MTTITPARPAVGPATRPRPQRPLAAARSIDPFRVLRRHMVLLVASGIAGAILGLATHIVCAMFFPLYAGEVKFEIRAGLEEATELGSQDVTNPDVIERHASTESVLATQRRVLERAVKKRDVQATKWFQSNFVAHGTQALIDEAVDELEEDIGSGMVAGTNLFRISWRSRTDADVPVVLNAIADEYIALRDALDTDRYGDISEVLTQELNDTTRQLEDLSQVMGVFIRDKGIDTLVDAERSQLANSMRELTQRRGEAEGELSLVKSAYAQTAAKLEGTVAPTEEDRRAAEQDLVVRTLESNLMQMNAQLRRLRDMYRDPDNFLVKKAEGEVRAMELEYEDKVREIMTENLRAQSKATANQAEGLKKMLDEMEAQWEEMDSQLRALTADMSSLDAMEKQQEHLEETRDMYRSLIKEVTLLRFRPDSKRVQIVERALTPREMAFPRIEIVPPLVAILVVGVVAGLVFLRELTDQRVKSASDLQLLAGARVLGVVPDLQEDPCRSGPVELVVRRCPMSVLAESYRQTWTLVEKAMDRAGHRSLLLVGGMPESGSTTVGTNLAATAAATGKRVVMVDANFRRPRLAAVLGVAPDSVGLGDVLTADVDPQDAIASTEFGFDLVPAGRPESRIFERLSNGRLDAMLALLRDRYDLVIMDSPPAIVAGDALAVAGKVDAAVLVVRANQDQRGLVVRLMNQLVEAPSELLGIVLNRPRFTAGGYFRRNFEAMAQYTTPPAA